MKKFNITWSEMIRKTFIVTIEAENSKKAKEKFHSSDYDYNSEKRIEFFEDDEFDVKIVEVK